MTTDEALSLPTLDDIRSAARLTAPYMNRTPVFTSGQVDERAGCRVYFKCENFQKVGAFKFRGASNAIFSMEEEEATDGVATHSSGNHGQAVALAARMKGVPAYIVMPEDAPSVKKRAVEGYGARVTLCEPSQQARESTLRDVVEETGATFIHPYNDPRIIAGQGTACLELLGEISPLDAILVPVGGGGLLSGSAIAAAGVAPGVRVIGCEPERANDAWKSFRQGKLIPVEYPDTIADGLRTSLGELSFACIRRYAHDIVTVTEDQIREAMRFIWERMNIIIEPSSAVPVAALFEGDMGLEDGRVGIILSGGNADLDRLPW